MNHRESSTFSSTSSWVINCPMLRAIRVGGQMSHPWTLILHCQMARRHLANDKAVPSVPTIKGMMSSRQGTSSSEMPWTTKWSQRVVLQVGLTVSSMFPSSPMSTWYPVRCPGLPLEDSGLPSAEHLRPSSSRHTTQRTGVCSVWKSSSNASSSSREAWAVPSPE